MTYLCIFNWFYLISSISWTFYWCTCFLLISSAFNFLSFSSMCLWALYSSIIAFWSYAFSYISLNLCVSISFYFWIYLILINTFVIVRILLLVLLFLFGRLQFFGPLEIPNLSLFLLLSFISQHHLWEWFHFAFLDFEFFPFFIALFHLVVRFTYLSSIYPFLVLRVLLDVLFLFVKSAFLIILGLFYFSFIIQKLNHLII